MTNVTNLSTARGKVEAQKIIDVMMSSTSHNKVEILKKITSLAQSVKQLKEGRDINPIISVAGNQSSLKNQSSRVSKENANNILRAAETISLDFKLRFSDESFVCNFDGDWEYVLKMPDAMPLDVMVDLAKELEMEMMQNTLLSQHNEINKSLREMARNGMGERRIKSFIPKELDTHKLLDVLEKSVAVVHYEYHDDGIYTNEISKDVLISEAKGQLFNVGVEPYNKMLSLHFSESLDVVAIKFPETISIHEVNEMGRKMCEMTSNNHSFVREHDPNLKLIKERMLEANKLFNNDPEMEDMLDKFDDRKPDNENVTPLFSRK